MRTSAVAGIGRRSAVRRVVVLLVSAAFVWIPAVHAHADCPALNVSCSVTEADVTTQVEDVVQTAVTAVTDAAPTPVDTVVDDPGRTATSAADDAVSTATDVVRDGAGGADDAVRNLAPVDEAIETVVGDRSPSPPSRSAPQPPSNDTEGRGSATEPPGGDPPVVRAEPPLSAAATSTETFVALGTPLSIFAGPMRTSPGSIVERLAGPAAAIARTLAFPVALILLVAAFVAVQNRLDRRDPKLALAPIGPDVVEFE